MSEFASSENTCKNCNHTFTKQYCNGCGQKYASRITNAHLVHEVMHVTFHADKGIFPFIKRLILSPGVMAKEYTDGKRKIFNPIQFLVLSVGFVILLMSITHFYEAIELWQVQSMPAKLPEMQKKLEGFNSFVQKNGNIIILILMPIFAYFGQLLFKKRENNYAEHLIVSVFAISLSNVLTAIMLAFFFFMHFSVMIVLVTTFCITLVSLSLTYKQFYKINWFQAVWKSIAVYMLTMLIYMLISFLITVSILALT